MSDSVTPWTTAHQAFLSITNCRSLPKSMSIESVVPSNHIILCHPLLLLPSIFLSIRILSNESALCIMWPKYWSFSFNIRPSSEHPGLISFRMDWLDLLAVQASPFRIWNSSAGTVSCPLALFVVMFSKAHLNSQSRMFDSRWVTTPLWLSRSLRPF